ncbi:hypothetical protein KI688_011017 [Linnemannia hyalina]|uniref:Uncharacterized protein n=1 Tax=Linnemannia hyalina TaxID=64524 RepID=A0A9P7XWG1_9FUNG|nr:hypothetical protein KI688_011017 [Linnemannia hyalina]
MIERADIEGSKSNVATNAWLPMSSSVQKFFIGQVHPKTQSSQHFDRYRTINRPPPVDHKNTTDTAKQERPTNLVHRSRYSVKPRTKKTKHEPLPAMKPYSWKSWKEKPESSTVDTTDAKPKNIKNALENDVAVAKEANTTHRSKPKLVEDYASS